MRAPTPLRVLISSGTLMIMLAGGAAPVLGDAAAEVQTPATTSRQSTTHLTQVLALRKHRHKKHHVRKHKRKVHQAQAVSVATAMSRWSGALNTSSASAVNAAYRAGFAPGLGVPTDFSGDESRCITGNTSSTSRAATQRAINFVRSLAGVAPVGFSADLNARSQATALMMSANRAVSHAPSRSWRCYTSTGAANAGRSNLVLSYPSLTSSGLVELYTTDPGSTNRVVGHRRWLLNPFATTMGSGSTRNANAITVVGPSSSSRPNPGWVAWPSSGYFPTPLEPDGRWSISSGNSAASFTSASVSVYRNGVRIQAVKNPVESGYAQPTMSWQVPASLAGSGSFRVFISNVKVGARSYSTSYSVRMFNPQG